MPEHHSSICSDLQRASPSADVLLSDVGPPNAFASELELWASERWRECHEAIMGRGAKDDQYRKKCLGSIVRRRAKENVVWLWRWIDQAPDQVLRLSPYFGRFKSNGYDCPPDTMGWAEYIRWLEAFTLCSSQMHLTPAEEGLESGHNRSGCSHQSGRAGFPFGPAAPNPERRRAKKASSSWSTTTLHPDAVGPPSLFDDGESR
jgi:hypothetical protein